METLQVELGDRSYPIYIGSGLLQQPQLLTNHISGHSAMLVSNTTVAPLYADQVLPSLQPLKVAQTNLPDGEQYKTLEVLQQIFSTLLEEHMDRSTTLIALGGGVIGDMTGFAAAAYQRGVNFIQIPTTLLAMVDSSVGGKTGVNHPLGKNMIGAFYQPRCVIIDTDTLETLEERQLSAGIAEIIKYGIIIDAAFFQWLEDNMEALINRDKPALAHAIKRSCEIKADVVAADEKERGQRALLNLGHTFGHAIETATGYGNWLHGEAVAVGMVLAADMANRLGWMDSTDVERIRTLVERARLPLVPPASITPDKFLELMAVDKKVINGQLRLVLPQGIGQSVVTADFPAEVLRDTLEAHCAST
jgi:3-dehydroquinate synthase